MTNTSKINELNNGQESTIQQNDVLNYGLVDLSEEKKVTLLNSTQISKFAA